MCFCCIVLHPHTNAVICFTATLDYWFWKSISREDVYLFCQHHQICCLNCDRSACQSGTHCFSIRQAGWLRQICLTFLLLFLITVFGFWSGCSMTTWLLLFWTLFLATLFGCQRGGLASSMLWWRWRLERLLLRWRLWLLFTLFMIIARQTLIVALMHDDVLFVCVRVYHFCDEIIL